MAEPTAAGGFESLPHEIFNQILSEVTSRNDLNSLCRCSRGLYWAVSDVLFTRAFEEEIVIKKGYDKALESVFVHVVSHDSRNLMEWLMFREHGSRLRESTPWMKGLGFTCLHSALLGDAPKVAIQLLKHGAELNEDAALYPDLKYLYVAIAQPPSSRFGSLDGPLRIACSYALPRTAEYLLIRGADPNTHSDFGFAAIHIAVRQRPSWSRFKEFSQLNQVGQKSGENVDKRRDPKGEQKEEKNLNNVRGKTKSKRSKAQRKSTEGKEEDSTFSPSDEAKDTKDKDPTSAAWEAKVLQTVKVLLRFGADCNLIALNSRHHQCSHECWKSLSCAPIGQQVLHIAAASGYTPVVSALVERDADIFKADGQGNYPVVHAMAQDHGEIVTFLLHKMERLAKSRAYHVNPLVCKTTRSTALHMACRFGHHTVVRDLLKRGADVDGVDSRGRTPLHEALGQSAPDLEHRLVETLYLLRKHNAYREAIDYDGRRAGEMGEKHRFSGVRALFEYATMARYDWQRLTEPKGGGEAETVGYIPPPDPSWYVNEEPEVPPEIHPDMARMKVPTWVKKESFPLLQGSGAQPKAADSTSFPSLKGPKAQPKTTEVTETEKPAETNEKKGKKGGRKKWNRVSLK
ncbi:ankyrin repeat-containing domain protein [Trichoderma pleuroticola]